MLLYDNGRKMAMLNFNKGFLQMTLNFGRFQCYNKELTEYMGEKKGTKYGRI